MGKVLSLGNQFRSAAGLVPMLLLTKLFGVSIWEACWAKGSFCLQYTNKSLFVCRVSFQLYSSSSSSPQNLIWCSRVHLMFSKAVCPENLNEASSPPIQLTPPTPPPLPPPDEKPAKLCLLSTNNTSLRYSTATDSGEQRLFGNDTVGLHSWRCCKCNVVLIKTPHNDTKVNVKLSNVYCLAFSSPPPLSRNNEIIE